MILPRKLRGYNDFTGVLHDFTSENWRVEWFNGKNDVDIVQKLV